MKKKKEPRWPDYELAEIPEGTITFGTSLFVRKDKKALRVVFPTGQMCTFEAMDEWEPIETAPRTGEHILVKTTKRTFGICGGKEQKEFMDVVHWWDDPDPKCSGWYPSNGPDVPYLDLTHWRSLS